MLKIVNQSIDKMKEAIRNYEIVGVQTTMDFATFVMDHPAFTSGDFDTHFVKKTL